MLVTKLATMALTLVLGLTQEQPTTRTSTELKTADFIFTLPAGWQIKEGGGASGMRFATLIPEKGPEVSVIRLSAMGGGLLNNVNRWRGQVFLPPITEEELPKQTTAIDVAGTKALLVDVTGPQGRIVGAILPAGGVTWFLKLQVAKPEEADPVIPGIRKMVETVRKA